MIAPADRRANPSSSASFYHPRLKQSTAASFAYPSTSSMTTVVMLRLRQAKFAFTTLNPLVLPPAARKPLRQPSACVTASVVGSYSDFCSRCLSALPPPLPFPC